MILSSESINAVIEICDKYKGEPSPLMLILSDCQKRFGYIPLEVQEIVSAKINVPVAEIYGVVTFYNFFSLEPKGMYIIDVCLGTACYVRGGQNILTKFEDVLGIKDGQTTEDLVFTLENVRCLGACAIAPVVSINGKIYPNMKITDVEKIVEEYREKAKEIG